MYAMSTKYLGNHFDIHGGGMDLKFTDVKLTKQSSHWTNTSQLLDACKHADIERQENG
jgi:cysteinyl-tRNA synthetase